MVRHILICGDVGVGKSTLIQKLLRESTRPLCGFVTKRIPGSLSGTHEVYIHPAAGERHCTDDNCVGLIDGAGAHPYPQGFDGYGASLLDVQPGALVLMDELGFLESGAAAFCGKVLAALAGSVPVLAAVKSKETPFLQSVKQHPNVRVYIITEENRDALFAELLPQIAAWNTEK